MLHYELTKSYIDFVSSLPFKEKGPVLWNSQAILSTAGGYLKMKVAELDEERSVFRVAEHTYLLVQINYSFIRLIDGMKTLSNPDFKSTESEVALSPTIKELVAKSEVEPPHDELQSFLEKNYFTPWFIRLFALLSEEDRQRISEKEKQTEVVPIKESEKEEKHQSFIDVDTTTASIGEIKSTPEIRKPKVKIAFFPLPHISSGDENAKNVKTAKRTMRPIDGAEYEKAILLELQKAYENRISKKKTVNATKLKHVKFAPKEIVISYDSQNSCLDLLLRRTRQNGCRLSNDNWLILLANTVDESFARDIESRYPNHVLYTDEPNKGKLDIAFIVKKNREVSDDNDDLGIKRIKSKTASFNKEMPSGAYENIDEEEIDDRPHSSFIRPVKSKTAVFAPVLPAINKDDDDEFDFQIDEDGFFFDSMDEGTDDDEGIEALEESSSEEESANFEPYPKHWHCYLCGKKKLYSGEPAQISKLGNGNIVYLCKKHRGKM